MDSGASASKAKTPLDNIQEKVSAAFSARRALSTDAAQIILHMFLWQAINSPSGKEQVRTCLGNTQEVKRVCLRIRKTPFWIVVKADFGWTRGTCKSSQLSWGQQVSANQLLLWAMGRDWWTPLGRLVRSLWTTCGSTCTSRPRPFCSTRTGSCASTPC